MARAERNGAPLFAVTLSSCWSNGCENVPAAMISLNRHDEQILLKKSV
jgi:hypothetical protein